MVGGARRDRGVEGDERKAACVRSARRTSRPRRTRDRSGGGGQRGPDAARPGGLRPVGAVVVGAAWSAEGESSSATSPRTSGSARRRCRSGSGPTASAWCSRPTRCCATCERRDAMSWIAVLLIGFAVTDLTHSVRRRGSCPSASGRWWRLRGAAGRTHAGARRRGAARDRRRRAGVGPDRHAGLRPTGSAGGLGAARVVLGGALVGAIAGAPASRRRGRRAARAVVGGQRAAWADVSADRFLLLLGAFAVQLSTGNVLVRLVLAATGTINPRARRRRSRPTHPVRSRAAGCSARWSGSSSSPSRWPARSPRPRRRRGQGTAPLPRALLARRAGDRPRADGVLPARVVRLVAGRARVVRARGVRAGGSPVWSTLTCGVGARTLDGAVKSTT